MAITDKRDRQKKELINAFYDELGDLPETVNGWRRDDTDDSIFTYWRARSNHINGAYEAVTARPRPSENESWLIIRTLDQFGHQVSQQTKTTREPEQADWLWNSAKKQMQRYDGSGAYEEPPGLPGEIGPWVLYYAHEGTNRETVWDMDLGRAEIHVEQIDMECFYGGTRRPHRVWYADYDMPPEEKAVIVDEIPRLSAYEIACHIMRNFEGEFSDSLEDIKGIGPAKSRHLSLLGITTPGDLREYLSAEDGAPNHHYSEAVDKLLTETIREQF